MWPTRAGRLDRPTLPKFVDSTRSSLPLPERPSDESAARSPMLHAFTNHVGVVQERNGLGLFKSKHILLGFPKTALNFCVEWYLRYTCNMYKLVISTTI